MTPTYSTDRLFTRDDLVDLFREPWPTYHQSIGLDEVHSWLLQHFGESRGKTTVVVPTDEIPFPPFDPPNTYDDSRTKYVNDYEQRRHNSRKYRELFAIANKPVFIPSLEQVSEYDDDNERARKLRQIGNL